MNDEQNGSCCGNNPEQCIAKDDASGECETHAPCNVCTERDESAF